MGALAAWVRELRGSNFYEGCVYYVGLNTFYVGQHFTWVIIFTWVAWVKYIFAWVKTFSVGQFFYVGQHFLCELKIFRESLNFCVGQFFL